MLIGISKIPKIPMGNPQIPILLLNGHTNSSSWSKDPNWNYEISAYIRIRFSRYLVGAPMPQDWFYNSPRNIYRAVSFKTRIWTGWTDFVAW